MSTLSVSFEGDGSRVIVNAVRITPLKRSVYMRGWHLLDREYFVRAGMGNNMTMSLCEDASLKGDVKGVGFCGDYSLMYVHFTHRATRLFV